MWPWPSPPDATILNLDHHLTNTRFGTVNVVEPTAVATAQVLAMLIETLGLSLDAPLATCLYTGILTDTNGLRSPNVTPEVPRLAETLLEAGANHPTVVEASLDRITEPEFALLQRVLPTLTRHAGGRIACLTVTQEDFAATGAMRSDLNEMVRYAIQLEGVCIGVLLREDAPGRTKVSLRSRDPLDVLVIAREFGGSGHQLHASFTLPLPLAEAKAVTVRRLEEAVSAL